MSGATLFSNATIIDGTGADRYAGDVLVNMGKIQEIAPAGTLSTDGEQIDASSK